MEAVFRPLMREKEINRLANGSQVCRVCGVRLLVCCPDGSSLGPVRTACVAPCLVVVCTIPCRGGGVCSDSEAPNRRC